MTVADARVGFNQDLGVEAFLQSSCSSRPIQSVAGSLVFEREKPY